MKTRLAKQDDGQAERWLGRVGRQPYTTMALRVRKRTRRAVLAWARQEEARGTKANCARLGRPGGLAYRGQAAAEFALLYAAAILPLTFMLVYVSQMLWIWHSVIDFNRAVAQFAATHCWASDNSGSNVLSWAAAHVPAMIDRDQFQTNAAGLTVAYYSQTFDGAPTPFDSSSCGGGTCIPDLVSVSVTKYRFNRFSGFFRLPSVTMPPFTTTVPMESGGYQDASGTCVADATQ